MTASRGLKPPARIVTALAALLVGVRVPLTMFLVGAQSSSNGGYNLSPSPIVTSSGDLGYSCNLAQEACAEEASCAECVAFISGGSTARRRNRRLADEDDDSYGVEEEEEPCSSRYPLLLSGSMISFCERVGIAYCCQYSNNTMAEACLAIDMAAEVWDCYLQDLECTVRDMVCYAGYGETETPTFSPTPTPGTHLTTAPTSSPTGNPTQASEKPTPTPMPTPVAGGRGLDLTPWPAGSTLFGTAGPSMTTINSGQRTRAGWGVLSSTCLFGLVASTVGWHGLF